LGRRSPLLGGASPSAPARPAAVGRLREAGGPAVARNRSNDGVDPAGRRRGRAAALATLCAARLTTPRRDGGARAWPASSSAKDAGEVRARYVRRLCQAHRFGRLPQPRHLPVSSHAGEIALHLGRKPLRQALLRRRIGKSLTVMR
jgi:hypothetical protein